MCVCACVLVLDEVLCVRTHTHDILMNIQVPRYSRCSPSFAQYDT